MHHVHLRKSPFYKVMTPERRAVFDRAMMTCRDPAKLEDLARAFAAEGLEKYARELRALAWRCGGTRT
jgi:hypothetical protein